MPESRPEPEPVIFRKSNRNDVHDPEPFVPPTVLPADSAFTLRGTIRPKAAGRDPLGDMLDQVKAEQTAASRRRTDTYLRSHFADVPLYLETMLELKVAPKRITLVRMRPDELAVNGNSYSLTERLRLVER